MSSLSLPKSKAPSLPRFRSIKLATALKISGVAAVSAFLVANGAAVADRVSDGAVSEYSVVMKPNRSAAAVTALTTDQGGEVLTSGQVSGAQSITVNIREDRLSVLKHDPNVAYVQFNNEAKPQVSLRERVSRFFDMG